MRTRSLVVAALLATAALFSPTVACSVVFDQAQAKGMEKPLRDPVRVTLHDGTITFVDRAYVRNDTLRGRIGRLRDSSVAIPTNQIQRVERITGPRNRTETTLFLVLAVLGGVLGAALAP